MAETFFLAAEGQSHRVQQQCDGCREIDEFYLPLPVPEFVERVRVFEKKHAACEPRPVTRCQYVDKQDGTCQHERNLTPECGLWCCPLT